MGVSLLHKNISVAVKIVATVKSVATLHFHVVFLFCDRFHWRRSFSFWCITSWSLTWIVNGIIIRSTWGCNTWYKWQLSRWGLKILFKNLKSIRVWQKWRWVQTRDLRTGPQKPTDVPASLPCAIIKIFLGNLHDWQENRELLEGINGHIRFLIHQVSFRTWCHLKISHK